MYREENGRKLCNIVTLRQEKKHQSGGEVQEA